jgi:hypothetical protein
MVSAQGYIRRTPGRSESSVVGHSPDSNVVSREAKKSPLLKAVVKERLLKALVIGEDLVFCEFWRSAIVL